MRITFVVGLADLSGGFRVIATYAQRLKQRGHDVLVVSRPRPAPSLRAKWRALRNGLPQPISPWRAPSHMEWTGVTHRLLEKFRPVTAADLPDADVVLATWWETAEWVAGLPASKGVKVHFIQDYEVWGGTQTVAQVDATCRLVMPKITPARWVKELLESQFGNSPNDITCVPNAVDLKKFTAAERGKQERPTVGFIYTPFLNKGTDIVIKAVELARASVPDLRVVCFGSVAPGAQLPLPEGFEFHHHVPDPELKSIYGTCDAWLFGTRKEGFGLPILEAMACRTPVIATPAGAAPELVGDAGGGTLVAPEDPQAMADAIVKVARMSDPAWRELSARAYAIATRYTWDDATTMFEQVLLDAHRKAPKNPQLSAA